MFLVVNAFKLFLLEGNGSSRVAWRESATVLNGRDVDGGETDGALTKSWETAEKVSPRQFLGRALLTGGPLNI